MVADVMVLNFSEQFVGCHVWRKFASELFEELILLRHVGKSLPSPIAEISALAMPLHHRMSVDDVRTLEKYRHQRFQFRRLERIHKLVPGGVHLRADDDREMMRFRQ